MKSKVINEPKVNTGLNIERVITFFLIALMGLGLYFNGYFFERQSLTVNILTSIFFLGVLIIYVKRKETVYYNKSVFFLGITFLVINILGCFYASNVRDAIQNVVLIANALIIFLLASQAFRKEKNVLTFVKGLYWSITSLAVVAIFSYAIGQNMLNFYPNTRLYTSIGYPNTAALLFVIALFVGLFLYKTVENKNFIYLFFNSLIFISFLKTESRGVLVILPILLGLYVLLSPKGSKVKEALNLISILIPSSVVYFICFNKNLDNVTGKDTLVAFIGFIILLGLNLLYEKIDWEKLKYKKVIALIFLIVFLLGFTTAFIIEKDKILDSQLVKRIEKLQSFEEDSSIYIRMIYIKDALKIVKDNLLLGTGAGGWNAEYRKYRSCLYYSSQVHNHYIQVLVENGVIGFLIYISLWILLIINLLKKYYQNKSSKELTFLLAAVAIALHSFMDFDLTYPVMYLVWWILFSLVKDEKLLDKLNINNIYLKSGVCAFVTLVFLLNNSLWLGSVYGSNGIKYMQTRNIDKAIESLKKSVMFDPFNPTSLVNLSQLYYAKGKKEKSLNTLDKAIKYNSTNFEWYIVKTRMLVDQGEYEKGYKIAVKAIEQAPFEEVVYYDTARFFLEQNNYQTMEYTEKILNLAKKEEDKIENSIYVKLWKTGERLNESSKIGFLNGQIYEKNANFDLAKENYFLAVNDKILKDNAQNRLNRLYSNVSNILGNSDFSKDMLGWKKCGHKGLKREIVKKDNIKWLNLSKNRIETQWWGVYQPLYEFIANQKYQLSFDAFSNYEKGQIRFFIHQIAKEKDPIQITRIINITSKVQNYKCIFTTDNLSEKEFDCMKFFVTLPTNAEKQDIFISNIKLKKID